MKIGVFGANGYLGGVTSKFLEEKGYSVVKLGRRVRDFSEKNHDLIDIFIDCSFPRDYYRKSTAKNYLDEMRNRLEYFNYNSKPYLYIASFSSLDGDRSKYAQLKKVTEELVRSGNHTLLRLGLVVDTSRPGGRYQELVLISRKLPFLFIPASSWFPIYVANLRQLQDAILYWINNPSIEEFCVGHESTLGTLLLAVNESKKLLFLNENSTRILANIIKFLPLRKSEGIKSISFRKKTNS